jgi:hypothetical protein
LSGIAKVSTSLLQEETTYQVCAQFAQVTE